jgi:DNA-binding protein Fis
MLQQVSNYEKVFQDTVRSILKNPVISADGELYKRVMSDLEKSLIEVVLDENHKSQTKSAKILGISRNTLRSRMKEYDLK